MTALAPLILPASTPPVMARVRRWLEGRSRSMLRSRIEVAQAERRNAERLLARTRAEAQAERTEHATALRALLEYQTGAAERLDAALSEVARLKEALERVEAERNLDVARTHHREARLGEELAATSAALADTEGALRLLAAVTVERLSMPTILNRVRRLLFTREEYRGRVADVLLAAVGERDAARQSVTESLSTEAGKTEPITRAPSSIRDSGGDSARTEGEPK